MGRLGWCEDLFWCDFFFGHFWVLKVEGFEEFVVDSVLINCNLNVLNGFILNRLQDNEPCPLKIFLFILT